MLNSKNAKIQTTNKEKEEGKSKFHELKEWIKVIVVSFLIAFVITSIVKPTIVIGHSMDNTLHDKDYLLVNRLAYTGNAQPHYKDIIVFNTTLPGDKVLIKRVIGQSGDKLKIDNGHVYINGKELKENYIGGQETLGNIDETIPKGKIFVMGDNRNNSLDSRFQEVGLVDKSQIIGKIMFRVFPFHSIAN